MKKLIALAAVAFSCSAAIAQNWTMDGGDTQRSGWVKDEKILTKDNVKELTLLWKVQTDVDPHALHALMTPVAIKGLQTASGAKNVLYVVGASNVLYAMDADSGKELWKKNFEEPASQQVEPKHLGFLGPGGTTGVPAISEADASGKRTVYMVDGKGNVVGLDAATGDMVFGPLATGIPNKFAVQLYKDQIIFADFRGAGILSVDIKTKALHKTVGFGGGGGLWGRRGPVITSDGTVWTTTGDGKYDVTTDPNNPVIGNSVVGFELKDGSWQVKDWFTPLNWDWLRKRDLDPNNTPTVFTYRGRELMAASGKECKVYLLDPKNPGGEDHHEPLLSHRALLQ